MFGNDGNFTNVLSHRGIEYGSVYRGILELMGRFGYLSPEEVMYGFSLSEQEARDRLKYLIRQEFVKSFESLVDPRTFYCLTKEGLSKLRSDALSDEVQEFDPASYRPFFQKHDRTLIKVFCALQKTLGPDFLGWLSERTLRQGESLRFVLQAHKETRVLDGLFQMMMYKEKFSPNSEGQLIFQGIDEEPWWCGFELELSLKSKARYRKQFKVLAECIYDRIQEKQKIPLMFFLCGTAAICDALMKYYQEQAETFGRCVFIFGVADRFLEERENAVLRRVVGAKELEIVGSELNRVKMKVIA